MKRIMQRTAGIVLGLLLGVSAWAGLETVTHISDLNASWPLGSDLASTSDDHIRNIKTALKNDFPNIGATVNSASAPVFAPFNDTNTGIYFPAADSIGFSTAGTSRASVNSTGNWTVSAPSSGVALTVTAFSGSGAVTMNDGGGNLTATFNSTASSGPYLQFQRSSANKFFIGDASNLDAGTIDDYAVRSAGAFGISTGGANRRVTVSSTGAVTIAAPSSGRALQTTGPTGNFGLDVEGDSTSGSSFGAQINAGTTSADSSLTINSKSSTPYFQVRGDGAILGRGATASALVDMTPDTGSFTCTYTGMSSATTGTCKWARVGTLVILTIAAITGTSNSTGFTLTGLPAAITPATSQAMPVAQSACTDSGGLIANCDAVLAASSTTITFRKAGVAAAFTASGSKGFTQAVPLAYTLQ